MNKYNNLLNFIYQLNCKYNKSISIEIKDHQSSCLRNKIIINRDDFKNLKVDELKSLIAHKYAHILYKHSNYINFWNYFIVKHIFLIFICSFSLDILFYQIVGFLSFTISIILILKERKNRKFAREQEIKSDLFAINTTNKYTFKKLIYYFKEKDENDYNFDLIIDSIILGKHHPSFKERLNLTENT